MNGQLTMAFEYIESNTDFWSSLAKNEATYSVFCANSVHTIIPLVQ